MKGIIIILRLMRLPNIIIIGLTAYLIRFCLFSPAFHRTGISFFLNGNNFLLLVLAIMMTTTAGYIINDIYDRNIDKYNRGEKQIIGKIISVKAGVYFYVIASVLGLILSFIVAYQTKYMQWLFFYPLATVLLWTYSYYLKRTPLWGNLFVSMFCSFVVLLIWFFEKETYTILNISNPDEAKSLTINLVFYSVFAFFSTLHREIIKDMEDMEGDKANNCRTYPVLYGIKKTKPIVLIVQLMLLCIIIIYLITVGKLFSIWVIIYGIICLILPVSLSIYKLIKAKEGKDYSQLNRIAKIIMVLGLLFLPVLSYL
ncbi:geranylgeranylglycerol-phosphate geranylgeranyltransferase [Bacteroidota bacterium]